MDEEGRLHLAEAEGEARAGGAATALPLPAMGPLPVLLAALGTASLTTEMGVMAAIVGEMEGIGAGEAEGEEIGTRDPLATLLEGAVGAVVVVVVG